ncbi:MAG: hypothetical protein QOJ81_728 [Chloroflexota bacterium]|nr:hypothetical protein [Chloroflexota bacterium]
MLRGATLALFAVMVCACGGAAPGATPTAGRTVTAPTASAGATSSGPAADVCASDWYKSPSTCAGEIGDRFVFECPPGGQEHAIFGTDTYTDDSPACVAAVHAGLLGFDAGGTVTVELTAGLDVYTASSRNGVDSIARRGWIRSFVFVNGD